MAFHFGKQVLNVFKGVHSSQPLLKHTNQIFLKNNLRLASSSSKLFTSEPTTDETSAASLNAMDHDDYFNVKSLVDMKEMFDARVHLGHHEGTWDPLTRPYIHGMRSTQYIIDLEKSVECLQCALNVLSHIVYRKGIVLFISTNPRFDHLIQKTARNSGEYFITRAWHKGLFNNASTMLGTDRLPDLIISFNNSRFERVREAITEAAMCNIPVIGLIDTDCDPRLVTYPVPGNDDTLDSMEYFCNVFEKTILNAKQRLADDEGVEQDTSVDITNDEVEPRERHEARS